MKDNIGSIALFLAVFIGISLIAASTSGDTVGQIFSRAKVPIAFITEESTPLVRGLERELEKVANIMPYEDDLETLQEAMFYDEISHIIRIPAGFTADFLDGRDAEIITYPGQSAGRAMYVDMAVESYLNTLRLYRRFIPDAPLEDAIANVHRDLSQGAETLIFTDPDKAGFQSDSRENYFNHLIFFNYQAYSLFAILILGISSNLLVFNSRLIRMRQACSPLSSRKQSLQLFLANFAYALFCWFALNAISLIFIPELIGTNRMYLFIANSFVLSFWASCVSFFIAHLAKSRNGISAITNVVALGTSFLAGVFVPQEFLGSAVLRVASFTPTYWFVLANNQIARVGGSIRGLSSLAGQGELLTSMGMQLMFGLAFLAMTLVLRKKRSMAAA